MRAAARRADAQQWVYASRDEAVRVPALQDVRLGRRRRRGGNAGLRAARRPRAPRRRARRARAREHRAALSRALRRGRSARRLRRGRSSPHIARVCGDPSAPHDAPQMHSRGNGGGCSRGIPGGATNVDTHPRGTILDRSSGRRAVLCDFSFRARHGRSRTMPSRVIPSPPRSSTRASTSRRRSRSRRGVFGLIDSEETCRWRGLRRAAGPRRRRSDRTTGRPPPTRVSPRRARRPRRGLAAGGRGRRGGERGRGRRSGN